LIEAHPTLGRQTKASNNRLFITKFKYSKGTTACPKLKTTGRWHKNGQNKNKAGINLKYRTLACKQYRKKSISTCRSAGREIDRSNTARR
jgi:hypothetical protein